jgi:hypothetical protein
MLFEMVSYGMIYIPCFMKVGEGNRGIFIFCFDTLRDCSVGIVYGRLL